MLTISNDAYSHVIEKGVFDYFYKINDIMRVYASFNIAFAFPSFITSFYGMNIPVPMQKDYWDSYGAFGIILALIAVSIGILAIFMKLKVLNLK